MPSAGPHHATDIDTMRHSTAHVLAKAVQKLYPGSALGIGPVIQDGFYYDIDVAGKQLSVDDLPAIEEEMRRIVKADEPFVRREISRDVALDESRARNERYKLEIIEGVPADETLSFYDTGSDWTDLCRGPHVPTTGQIGPFKLLSVAGAYWRGDEARPMLQRIYGTTWNTQEELDQYLWRLEEARRRDHRRLGRELDLFSVSEEVGPGLILWHPKGAIVRVEAEDFARKTLLAHGYDWVFTPHIGRAQLWGTSGHLDFYKENMYAPMDIEGEEYFAKPMNCPFHIEIYKSHIRSYRDLPQRYAEYGTVYRYERSGVLHGLTRVRGFTQDDAHVFCRPDQVEREVLDNLELSLYILRTFGLTDFKAFLSTRPDKSVGEPERWDFATDVLRTAIDEFGLPYELDEGGGAFYGPKIDLKVNDALGREWQLSTIQFDFNLPERFDLHFIGDDGQEHRPYMVHRALFGSMERFFGVLVEHFGGAFPLWLAPVQATLIPIADRHLEYAEAVAKELKGYGLRVEVDGRRERMQNKIRQAETQRVPYILVMGDRDVEANAVSVRARGSGDLGSMARADFLARIRDERDTRVAQ